MPPDSIRIPDQPFDRADRERALAKSASAKIRAVQARQTNDIRRRAPVIMENLAHAFAAIFWFALIGFVLFLAGMFQ